jgi:hypothetical protein
MRSRENPGADAHEPEQPMTTKNPIDPTDPQPAGGEPHAKAEPGPTFAAPQPHVRDLSAEIARAMPRSAGERVTCRWIAGNQYRCNWWGPADSADYDNPQMFGLTVTTHRVRRSQWVRVTKNGNTLLMDPAPAAPASHGKPRM